MHYFHQSLYIGHVTIISPEVIGKSIMFRNCFITILPCNILSLVSPRRMFKGSISNSQIKQYYHHQYFYSTRIKFVCFAHLVSLQLWDSDLFLSWMNEPVQNKYYKSPWFMVLNEAVRSRIGRAILSPSTRNSLGQSKHFLSPSCFYGLKTYCFRIKN